ncbi:MAG: Lcl C-terminal domain-containing protein [Candidatus Heimdallarchaeaceae archaeon]
MVQLSFFRNLIKFFVILFLAALISNSISLFTPVFIALPFTINSNLTYPIVDTNQHYSYDDLGNIIDPKPGDPFYGQDAQYQGNAPQYLDNGDGTITDLVTGLIWQKAHSARKYTWYEAFDYASNLTLAGYSDWRLPTIKELYSLIDFNGNSRAFPPVPYIDTTYFDFQWGNVSDGERLIDAQYWSSTKYVGTTMMNDSTAFGVNFADGRIKGYPTDPNPFHNFTAFVRCVRGSTTYGINNFVDNGDGTITDTATGLMWMKYDSGEAMNWQEALEYAESLSYAGYSDWRLPNAKELQSIVDYTRAPDALDLASRGPAIDPIFNTSNPEAWYWSSTTHLEGPGSSAAVYIAFGRAMGYMPSPTGEKVYMNVHGAGAQRSDPKSGDPNDYAGGLGPQGDEIRIYNYVRCVRDASNSTIDNRIQTNRASIRWAEIVFTVALITFCIIPTRQKRIKHD